MVATLLNTTVPRTLDVVLKRIEALAPAGAKIEAWSFEGPTKRRAAEKRLSRLGYTARFRSAYKPLVHTLLEEFDLTSVTGLRLRLPNHPNALPGRFLIEAYPLAKLLGDRPFDTEVGESELDYGVVLTSRDAKTSEFGIFAPNRVALDHLDCPTLRPTGWLRIHDSEGRVVLDEAIETEYEAIFNHVNRIIGQWPLRGEPYFERLDIKVSVPGEEVPLHFGNDVMSPAEGLQLDLFWLVFELLQQRSGRALADFTLKGCVVGGDFAMSPGQIVPMVRFLDGSPRVEIVHRALEETEDFDNRKGLFQFLDTAGAPLDFRQIDRELDELNGEKFSVPSLQGRSVSGTYVRGTSPGVMITAAQHPNETSGVIGALRAAHELRADQEAHFAIVPVSNPDGYQLHQRLLEIHPQYMHSAPRFSAHGSDIVLRKEAPFFEIEAWREAHRRTDAKLHVNLHAMNSHEVNRPLSGYLMRSWAHLMIPKGFYMIMYHHPHQQEEGRWLLEQITEDLSKIPELVIFNRQCQAAHRAHVGDGGYELINGFPCFMQERSEILTPLMLVTEYPDISIWGEAYRLAHLTQMEATLSAIRHFVSRYKSSTKVNG